MKAGVCIHYNGAINPMSDGTCEAGVNYRQLVGGDVVGWVSRLPCVPMEPRGGEKVSCSQCRTPTAEEIAQHEAETAAHINKLMVAYTGNVRAWRNANKWDRRNPKGATGKVPCQACGTGEIHLSMAAYNGHVHGACTTQGCVSWME